MLYWQFQLLEKDINGGGKRKMLKYHQTSLFPFGKEKLSWRI